MQYTGLRVKVDVRNRVKVLAAQEAIGINEMVIKLIELYEKDKACGITTEKK